MKTAILFMGVILYQSVQLLHSSFIHHTTTPHHLTTTTHHITTPKPRPERHGVYFHYPHGSLEHLLLALSYYNRLNATCYLMPLSNQDVHDIQTKQGLVKMEAYMLHQIASKHYYLWTYDDMEVRIGSAWTRGCRDQHRPIYRVYRI